MAPSATSPGAPGGGPVFGAGSTRTVGSGANACAAEAHAAETLPLDLFIMMDQSGSMREQANGGDKWTLVAGALSSFVQSPRTAGISAGIQYFGLAGTGTVMGTNCTNPYYCPPAGGWTAGNNWNSSCAASDYANPDVEIAPLPANGQAIAASIGRHGPSSDTPTQPALQGAIDHATAWANAHPGHPTIVVLATDGEPIGCGSTVQGVAQVAAQGANGNPKILTFVIGVGSGLGSLNAIAQAGGSSQAFIVDTGQDVNAQFLDALDQIRGSVVLPCEYRIPSPTDGAGSVDFARVNVAYTPGAGPQAGQAATVYQVGDSGQCAVNGGGWFYDDPANPQKIELCGETCNQVTGDARGQVDVLVGCATEQAPH